jgi:uncharacterized protein YjlB
LSPVLHAETLTWAAAQGVFQGESTILVGCGTNDTEGGQQIDVHAGDVIVLPAGTGHCSLQSTGDYRYIGVYPKVGLPIFLVWVLVWSGLG